MNKSVVLIFLAFIVVLFFIRFLSVDHFDTNNVSIVANSILSSTLDNRYQCLVDYEEELLTSIQNCHNDKCKVNAHMNNSKILSGCLGVDVPELQEGRRKGGRAQRRAGAKEVSEPAFKIADVPVPEPVPEPEPEPCDELSCYMSMLSYHNQQQDFNNVINFPDSCRNCPEKTNSEFTPIADVTDVYTPYDWSKHDTPDSVKYPGNSTDNYANYCNWGLEHSWCSNPQFSNACRNECAD
jgi:hypothetical protein